MINLVIKTCIEVQNYAIKFYLSVNKSEKLSFPKLVKKFKTSTKTILSKINSIEVSKILVENLLELLNHPRSVLSKKSQKVFVWDLWRFGIEEMIKYNMNVLLAKIFDERTLLENYYNLEIPFVQFLREIYKQLGKESESKSFNLSLQSTSEISEYSSIPSLFSDSLCTRLISYISAQHAP